MKQPSLPLGEEFAQSEELRKARKVARLLYRWAKRTVMRGEPWPHCLAQEHPWLDDEGP